MTRRDMLLALLGTCAAPATLAVGAPAAEYAILVGGPRGGTLDRWSKALALGLGPGIFGTGPQANGQLLIRTSGGIDGVTAANHLQALVVPDGRTAVMLPGNAVIAYLTGDPRVHFEIGTWVPVLAGIGSAVLIVRGGVRRLTEPQPLRLAANSPESADLAALLALARLDVAFAPLFGLRDAETKLRAFAANEADAVLVHGEDVPAAAASLKAWGGMPVCSLVVPGEAGPASRDAAFPGLPTIAELADMRHARPLAPPLAAACHAATAAVLVDFVLVLPHLTAPASIALWRNAAAGAVGAPALQSAAYASAITLGAGPAAEAALSPFSLAPNALLALQAWLVAHFDWRRA